MSRFNRPINNADNDFGSSGTRGDQSIEIDDLESRHHHSSQSGPHRHFWRLTFSHSEITRSSGVRKPVNGQSKTVSCLSNNLTYINGNRQRFGSAPA